jgi:uncharacterized membrane protein YidH (DUF202 family)
MFRLKKLKSAKEPRLYLSIERTFLSFQRLAIFLVSLAIFLWKLRRIAVEIKGTYLSPILEILSKFFLFTGILISFFSIPSFMLMLKFLEEGVEVDPKEVVDPRIYMAGERTFLSWIRTAIGLIVFGFVIEKFEFFLEEVKSMLNIPITIKSGTKTLHGFGILFILLGLITIILGLINFYRTVKRVEQGAYKTNTFLYLFYGTALFLSCLLVALYILKIVVW